MTHPLPVYFAFVATVAFAQTVVPGAPSFDADHVFLFDHPVPLQPGLMLSIFGNNLGPSRGCRGDHDGNGIYQKDLCDTQVLVGGIPSGLLWVQTGQINFQVPEETPTQGTTDLAVVYQGRRSRVVAMPLGVEIPTLSLDSPARVGMPVWLKVKMPYDRESDIRYPFDVFPAGFGCNEVEVRRNGVMLSRIADVSKQAFGGITMIGNPCGGIASATQPNFRSRLPLHLQYRFDRPGTYEVRLRMPPNWRDRVPTVTPWTKIEILPADPGARERWLAATNAQAPTSTGDLLADFLPSILGNPDEETLQLLRPYLYHPDRLVRDYAMYGLTYWPDAQVAPKLWEWILAEGPTDATIGYFLHLRDFAAEHTTQLMEASIPYLQSNSPVVVYGALYVLSIMASPPDSPIGPYLRLRACDAMIRAKDHIIQVNPEDPNNFITRLAQYRMSACY
jgi:hypothetical protein